MADDRPYRQLTRELGTFGAVMLGLGSIRGTGVFVSIGIAAGVAGPGVVYSGIRRSNALNIVIVSITLGSLTRAD